jgi:hypothetical protein
VFALVNDAPTELQRKGTSPQALRIWAAIHLSVAGILCFLVIADHSWDDPLNWTQPLFFALFAVYLWRLARNCTEPSAPSILSEIDS